jgi:hypothetical protein
MTEKEIKQEIRDNLKLLKAQAKLLNAHIAYLEANVKVANIKAGSERIKILNLVSTRLKDTRPLQNEIQKYSSKYIGKLVQ